MYDEGRTISDIRKRLHCRAGTLDQFLRDNYRGKRPKNTLMNTDFLKSSRKYSLNESYFTSIDSPNKAYWLGFLYADGYVHKRTSPDGHDKGGSLELTLASIDEGHLESFLYDLSSTHPITRRTVTTGGKPFLASRVSIASIQMVNDLISHGCVQAKSLILQPPQLEKHLRPHFVRGYMDGDGSVGFYPDYRGYGFSVVGTREMLEYIRDESGVSKNINVRPTCNSAAFVLSMCGPTAAQRFFSYIYHDKTVFLERKWEKALTMIKYLGGNTERSATAALADLLD